jgi:murein DD-endopeptidase MepM/ murein hydrolase activator NlpD
LYSDLFEGRSVTTSEFGLRDLVTGELEFHPGVDRAPIGGVYGQTRLLAPGRVIIGGSGYLSGYGDILTYMPEGTQITVFHAHTSLLPGLEPGMIVNLGTPIGVLTNTGITSGPHTHIEIHQGVFRYDPSTVFK